MSIIGPRPALWNQDVLTAERDKYNANDWMRWWMMKACFILAGIDEKNLLQAVTTAIEMVEENDNGIPVPDYVEENVSTRGRLSLPHSCIGVIPWAGTGLPRLS